MKTSVLARVAAVAAAAVALAACSAINPITTQDHYEPSDGVQVAIGDDVKGINLLVVTTAKDAPAVLTGSLFNDGVDPVSVTVSIDGAHVANVDVPGDSTVQLGTRADQQLVQGASPAAPGGVANVWIGAGDTGALQSPVPVVDGTLPAYQGVVDSIPPLPVEAPSPSPSPTS